MKDCCEIKCVNKNYRLAGYKKCLGECVTDIGEIMVIKVAELKRYLINSAEINVK